MSKLNAAERLAEMQKAKEAAKANGKTEELVSQLTHTSAGEPDFAELAEKLEKRKAEEAKGENDDHVKMTIYVEKNLADSFNALITRRGQQKEFVNTALRDFVLKKTRELGIE